MHRYLKIGWIVCCCCIVASIASAQRQVKGKVVSKLENKTMQHAVVALLNSGDSTFRTFTRTNEKGEFKLPVTAPGKYLLLLLYPGFTDYMDTLKVAGNADVDLGTITLMDESIMLKELIVNGKLAMRIKGDTIEYDASSFIVREGGNVEDLLKKLPGFQVDSKGKITAYGKKVEKVLVDGEEFFGDDPTIATQNLLATAVDKVELYDRKSDLEQITGVTKEDANKTVNIVLKESARKGDFGRLEAGAGSKRIINEKAMYNSFRANRRFSVYGAGSKTDAGLMSGDDRSLLGLAEDKEYDAVSGYYLNMGVNEERGNWNTDGIPEAYTAGGLLSDKWNQNKNNIYLAYKFNSLLMNGNRYLLTRTFTQDKALLEERNINTSLLKQQHQANIKYEWRPDSFYTIKLLSAASYATMRGRMSAVGQTTNEQQDTLNKGVMDQYMDATSRKWESQLLISRTFRKKGRSLSAILRLGVADDKNTGTLDATYRFFSNGINDSTSLISQLKQHNGNATATSAKIVFSEPLAQGVTLVTYYSFSNLSANAARTTYDKDDNGKYNIVNPLFSNDFGLNVTDHTANAMLRMGSRKWKWYGGSGLSFTTMQLDNHDSHRKDSYRFTNFAPTAGISYNFSAQDKIGIFYNGTTIQPSLFQLQPLYDNADPLNVYVGNPQLKLGFNHTTGLNFNAGNPIKGTVFRANTGITFRNNDITTLSLLDVNTGKRTYMPVNVSGNNNWYFWGMHSWGDNGKSKWKHQVNANASGGRNITIANEIRYTTDYTMLGGAYYLRYEPSVKIQTAIGLGAERFLSHIPIDNAVENNYWNYSSYASLTLGLPWGLQLYSDMNGNVFQRVKGLGDQRDAFIWNASLSRGFLKQKQLRASVDIKDILDQQINFNRSINSNIITESRTTLLGRYVLLNLVWTFNRGNTVE